MPLLDVVEVTRGEAFSSINRRDGRRVVNVGLDVEPKREIGRVLEAIQSETLPQLRADYPGTTWSFEGSQAEMRDSTAALWGGFALAMAVVYALLAIAFGSYLQPLIVMVAIPFGVVGAVIGHILLGFDLSLISFMGVIALSGVVVNDALIMIDFANRKRGEMSAFDAIHVAGIRRFRPIILTTADDIRWPDADHHGNLAAGGLPGADGHFPGLRHRVRDLDHPGPGALPVHGARGSADCRVAGGSSNGGRTGLTVRLSWSVLLITALARRHMSAKPHLPKCGYLHSR